MDKEACPQLWPEGRGKASWRRWHFHEVPSVRSKMLAKRKLEGRASILFRSWGLVEVKGLEQPFFFSSLTPTSHPPPQQMGVKAQAESSLLGVKEVMSPLRRQEFRGLFYSLCSGWLALELQEKVNISTWQLPDSYTQLLALQSAEAASKLVVCCLRKWWAKLGYISMSGRTEEGCLGEARCKYPWALKVPLISPFEAHPCLYHPRDKKWHSFFQQRLDLPLSPNRACLSFLMLSWQGLVFPFLVFWHLANTVLCTEIERHGGQALSVLFTVFPVLGTQQALNECERNHGRNCRYFPAYYAQLWFHILATLNALCTSLHGLVQV